MPATHPSALARLRHLRRHARGILWRGLVLVSVFAAGLGALLSGVGFSERPGVPEADLLTQIYDILGLFVLGGMDLGTPEGGPRLGRAVMWLVYFAAPTVTAASVIEGVLRAMDPERWRLRRIRKHIIVVGCGSFGRLYLDELRARRPLKPVIVVEMRPDHPLLPELREVYRAHHVPGNIRDPLVLDSLRLQHADQVLLLTGDDFANLDAATKILTRVPALASRTVVHVRNLHFMRVITNTRVARQCAIFNGHQEAAQALVRGQLIAHFQRTEPRDVVVLAGFGRFGQTVLDVLQHEARGTFAKVVIIDSKAEEATALFHQQVGFDDFYSRQVIEGDLRDPRIWGQVEGVREVEPVFIIGCGDDGTNLRTALWVKASYPQAFVVVRNFYRSSFTDEVSREGGILAISVADLVAQSMPESWFGES